MGEPSDPTGKPILRLEGNVLTGASAGKQIYSLTRLGVGVDARPPAGRYQVLKPILHPIVGRVAVVVPSQEWVKTTAASPAAAPNILSGTAAQATIVARNVLFTLTGGMQASGTAAGAAKAANVLGITAGPSGNFSSNASFSPHQGFVLTNDNVVAANALVVLGGFDEFMDALDAAGGATLEIVG